MRFWRSVAEVSLPKILSNYQRLFSHSKAEKGVPMVKADAYGHGLIPVARLLAKEKSVKALGVAAMTEGVELRKGGLKKPIWIFSDCAPWNEDVSHLCRKFQLTPVLSSEKTVRKFLSVSGHHKIPFHLKFNTGMNRLGISPGSVDAVLRDLKQHKVVPEGICTHFAMSEKPTHRLTKKQISIFRSIAQKCSELNISHIHSENTSGILNRKKLGLDAFCNVVRPGIGIYGYGAGKFSLRPAMSWKVRVLKSGELSKNECVGYGATYRAKSKTLYSVLSIGYGDGFLRSLSGKELLLGSGRDRRVNVLGRVNMDLITVGYPFKEGTDVEILGSSVEQGEKMAKSAGTIVYEVLTSISSRVPRSYK